MAGSLPASVKAWRIENMGRARQTSTSTAARPKTSGWRWTVRLHRYQKPRSSGSAPLWSRRVMASLSMARPEKPSMAGSRVVAASMTSTTAAMAPMARPRMKGSCRRKRPNSDRMTVVPANTTARPEVASETATASRGSRPSARPCR